MAALKGEIAIQVAILSAALRPQFEHLSLIKARVFSQIPYSAFAETGFDAKTKIVHSPLPQQLVLKF